MDSWYEHHNEDYSYNDLDKKYEPQLTTNEAPPQPVMPLNEDIKEYVVEPLPTLTTVDIDDMSVTGNNVAGITTSGNLPVTDYHDLNVSGISVKDFMEEVSARLAILQPNEELHEKYPALKDAYDHYKTIEALIHQTD
jgi:hypothetical protein